ncbi:replicative DNA helicase [Actinomadura sp. NBRC 104412]|uniref:replicative DNA helicase n=1 Tax=Actinomadura sp. NBRC 104412 TaxID=3032203 RepID=UPI0024A54245|nr:replicative DNA helicase [Actinomadura sp. NBRC 104412]GLZ09604.1 replicative DNA helicase [Actinomadura sp. NBRC 104412]
MTIEPINRDMDDAPPEEYRQPRHDLEAERSVLGAIMLSADTLDEVTSIIGPGDFYRPAHQIIYEVIRDLARQGAPVDAVAVHSAIQDRGMLGKVGGGPYIHTILSTPPTAANGAYYAHIVRRCARMRALVTTGTYLWQMGMNGDPDQAEEYVARAHQRLIAHDDKNGHDPPTFAEALMQVMDRIERGEDTAGRITAPYADLDRLLGGFRPGQLITIAARPGGGKSIAATDIARHTAMKQNMPVFLSSVEMNREEIMMRIVSAETRVGLHAIRNGNLTDDDWLRIADMVNRTTEAPLIIDDTPNVTLDTLRASLRRMERRADVQPARLLIVDYLQLLKSIGKAENRQVEVSELSRGLKLIAREFHIPVVMLAQLNRNPEVRADKTPAVSDLRESGAVEQDSDVVILIHRPDMYEKAHPRAGEADLIVGKNRNGPTATVTVAFQGHYSRFADMAADHLQK